MAAAWTGADSTVAIACDHHALSAPAPSGIVKVWIATPAYVRTQRANKNACCCAMISKTPASRQDRACIGDRDTETTRTRPTDRPTNQPTTPSQPLTTTKASPQIAQVPHGSLRRLTACRASSLSGQSAHSPARPGLANGPDGRPEYRSARRPRYIKSINLYCDAPRCAVVCFPGWMGRLRPSCHQSRGYPGTSLRLVMDSTWLDLIASTRSAHDTPRQSLPIQSDTK